MKQTQIINLLSFVIIFLSGSFTVQSQNQQSATHNIEISTRVPFYFGLGYEYETPGHWSFRSRLGYLTSPYDKLLFDLIPFEEDYDASISAFKDGWITEVGAAYAFRNNRATVSVQRVMLSGEISSVADLKPLVAEEVPYIDFLMPFLAPHLEGPVQMKSAVFLVSAGYERLIQLKDPRWELSAGLSFTRYITSGKIKSKIDNPVAKEVYFYFEEKVNSKTEEQFQKYLYFPTIDIAVRYKFKFPKIQ